VFAYIVRRLVLMLVTLFGISVIIFVLLRFVPGNIVDILFDAAGFVDPGRQGEPGEGTRARPADLRAVSEMDRRACCTATSAIPTCPRSPRCRRSCREFRSPRGWPALALAVLRAIGIPLGVISAVKARAPGSITPCASSA
jgi:peptide/nickel transport system permease protein